MVGVFGAMTATFVNLPAQTVGVAAVLMLVGGVLGLVWGMKVSPIALPQTVAAFHSLVGLAAMCTSIGSFWANPSAGASMENVSAILGDFIGGVTLTGSVIAFGKLNGNLSSKPLNLPMKNYLNLGGLLLFIGMMYSFFNTESVTFGISLLLSTGALACIMGVHL